MDSAKVFTNGGSQAIRLPKTCRFDTEEVFVNKIGNVVILCPKEERWKSMLTSLDYFTDDFLIETAPQLHLEKREEIK